MGKSPLAAALHASPVGSLAQAQVDVSLADGGESFGDGDAAAVVKHAALQASLVGWCRILRAAVDDDVPVPLPPLILRPLVQS